MSNTAHDSTTMDSPAKHQILLVEDDGAIMDTLTIFLQYEGYEVLKARSVERAMEVLKEIKPDLVLLDYMLQDNTAEPVIEFIRSQYAKLPVILLTAADDPSGKARNIGADGVVAKPFELDVLLGSVRNFLEEDQPASPPVLNVVHTSESLLQ